MIKIGDVLIIIILVLILFIAITAAKRGFAGFKISNTFDAADKKIRIGYKLVSAIHMIAGLLITSCYIIAGIFILVNFIRR